MKYDTGLDRHFGLIELGIASGDLKKAGNRVELPSGSKQFAKELYTNPEQYFTSDLMGRLEEYVKIAFSYGFEDEVVEEEIESEVTDEVSQEEGE